MPFPAAQSALSASAGLLFAADPAGVDIVIVTGDAFVDHPSFGAAVIARVLAADGWRVGILAQPQEDSDYT
ncbi:MAG: hypothetical protein FWF49_06060, partial [Oscillospiraceae bacterium]|nr:hypothetical protein [Oscillospiraceae bacterium]